MADNAMDPCLLLPLCSSWSCAFSYVRAIERWYGGIKRSDVLSSAIDSPILNIAKLSRKWIIIEVKVGDLTCGCTYFLTRSPPHLRSSRMRWPNRYHKQLTKSLSDRQLFTLYFRRLHELPFALFRFFHVSAASFVVCTTERNTITDEDSIGTR